MSSSTEKPASSPWIRETLDSFAVALILAFLFRAFVAEAFVIPTGSMAPTLMGAHKDVTCSQCGYGYQCSASDEFESKTGAIGHATIVGTTCPMCRFEQPVDLKNDANHATFSGDRILVSKLAYALGDPQRWQVIVFKYPYEAKTNYIKRLIGLPNETVRVEHGNIYVKKADETEFHISRKPPALINELLQPVADTNYLSEKLIAAGLPSAWQPAGPINTIDAPDQPEGLMTRWSVNNVAKEWTARLAAEKSAGNKADDLNWLRYYHYQVSAYQWWNVEKFNSLPTAVLPRTARLITDFAHYNFHTAEPRSAVYEGNTLRNDYSVTRTPDGLALVGSDRTERTNGDGRDFATSDLHWVGDLACEFNFTSEVDADSQGQIAVDLVEAGVHFQAAIDLADGGVRITAIQDGVELRIFADGDNVPVATITGKSSLRGSKSGSIKFANFDDSMNLWINDELIEMSPSNAVVLKQPISLQDHRPRYSPQDPADAAPVGIAASGQVALNINRARVWRDIYYVSTDFKLGSKINDYSQFEIDLQQSMSPAALNHFRENTIGDSPELTKFSKVTMQLYRDALFTEPALWNESPLFDDRRSVEFDLGPDQYFPMGDNSSRSADARGWRPQHYVHRDLMIGRAIIVFWPHYWNAPIPFTPNFKRFGLIR